jgi:hypothetical protein
VLLALAILMTAAPLLAQQGANVNDYMRGKAEGEAAAQGKAIWFLAGCGLNLTGVILAYLVKPSPPGEALLGKSPEYIMGYTEGFGDKSRDKNAIYAVEGCCTFWAAYVVVYAALYIWALSLSSY